jgi:hypothetical protein
LGLAAAATLAILATALWHTSLAAGTTLTALIFVVELYLAFFTLHTFILKNNTPNILSLMIANCKKNSGGSSTAHPLLFLGRLARATATTLYVVYKHIIVYQELQ